jgi:hypothetical protein
LNIPITGHGSFFPSQCTSHLSQGETITYESTTPSGGGWGPATSIVAASTSSASTTGPTIVYGQHVNGYNVIAAVQTSNSATTATTGTSSMTSSSQSASSTSTAQSNSSLSSGATAGIAIACVLGAIATIIGAWFVFWRRRQRRVSMENKTQPTEYGQHTEVTTYDPPKFPQEMEVPKPFPELSTVKGENHTVVHEMGTS